MALVKMTDTATLAKNAIEMFNREEFFECHDALEEIWLEDFGSDRLFYQGLIQVAVGFHHVTAGKLGAGRTMMSKALEKLAAYPEHHGSIQMEKLRRDVREWKESLDRAIHDQTGCPLRPFPKIQLTPEYPEVRPQPRAGGAANG